jgi:hypothetical protein
MPRKETIFLGAIALLGLAGLVVLQFSREQSGQTTSQKSIVQNTIRAQDAPAAEQRSTQRISGNLLNVNVDSEAGKPYFFRMTNHAMGATYILDPGDGSKPIPFDDQGRAKHTFRLPGVYKVTLSANYEGQSATLQSIQHQVGQPIQKEKVSTIIDY